MKGKKIICTALACSMSLSSYVFSFANENNNITDGYAHVENFKYEVNLIEDNGEPYQEIIIDISPYLKASGTYETTYDMKGGVYTQQTWNASSTPTFDVTITPKSYSGIGEAGITVYLEKKSILWDGVDNDSVSIKYGGTVSLTGKGSGQYRLHFVNNSGFQASGDIEISYSWN